jgi:HEAT repeat protein
MLFRGLRVKRALARFSKLKSQADLETLGRLGDRRAIPVLLDAAAIESLTRDSVRALNAIDPTWTQTTGAESVIPAIVSHLPHSDLESILNRIDPEWRRRDDICATKDLFCQRLSSAHEWERLRAAQALACIGDERAMPALFGFVKSEENCWRIAKECLNDRFPDWPTHQALRRQLAELAADAPYLREGILTRMDDIDRTWTSHPEIRPAITSLVVALGSHDSDRQGIADYMLRRIDLGWESTPEARAAMPTLLAQCAGGYRVSLIVSLLDRIDKHWRTSTEARVAAEQFIEALRMAGATPSGLSDREQEALDALGRLQVLPDSEIFVRLVGHPELDVRVKAIAMLGAQKSRESTELLVRLLDDTSDRVFRVAAKQLLSRGDPESEITGIEYLLNAGKPDQRRACVLMELEAAGLLWWKRLEVFSTRDDLVGWLIDYDFPAGRDVIDRFYEEASKTGPPNLRARLESSIRSRMLVQLNSGNTSERVAAIGWLVTRTDDVVVRALAARVSIEPEGGIRRNILAALKEHSWKPSSPAEEAAALLLSPAEFFRETMSSPDFVRNALPFLEMVSVSDSDENQRTEAAWAIFRFLNERSDPISPADFATWVTRHFSDLEIAEALLVLEKQSDDMRRPHIRTATGPRIRSIGEALSRNGGLKRMERIHGAICNTNKGGALVNVLWDGIAGWVK